MFFSNQHNLPSLELKFFLFFSGNCLDVIRTVSAETYNDNTPNFFIDIEPNQLLVSFQQDADEVESQSLVQRDNVNDIVSNVGGGLGLYLGFSIISTLMWIFEGLIKRCSEMVSPTVV